MCMAQNKQSPASTRALTCDWLLSRPYNTGNCAAPATKYNGAALDKCLPYNATKRACQFPANADGFNEPVFPASGFTPKVGPGFSSSWKGVALCRCYSGL